MYSCEDVMTYCEEDDVKFIRLAFCDLNGKLKNISIMPDELKRAFFDGVSLDASAISSFGSDIKSDLFLHPDPSTLAVLPWRPTHGKVVRMFCGIKNSDGTQFERDSRFILQKAIEAAAKKNIFCYFGAECEFYLFKTDDSGMPTKIPFDNAGYMDVAPEDKGENVRREICFTLLDLGIKPESSHHEEGPGQNEIDFRYSDPMTSADNTITFKSVVKTVAMRNGLHADFSPKPIYDKSGNGMHINMSVKSDSGENVSEYFMAGILKHVKEMTAFFNPVEDSYKRLGEMKAPRYITWSYENRSQLIRIPAAKGEYKRIELRSPDPEANPYLVYALLIYAGLDGIENRLSLQSPADINFYTAGEETLKQFETLPDSLENAKKIAYNSEFIKSILPFIK